jgi:hypothetical protein
METTFTTTKNSVAPKKQPKKTEITILDLERLLISVNGRTLSVEEATDYEFETFIKQAADIVYGLEERVDWINSLLGKTLVLNGDEVVVDKKEWLVNG